MTAVLIALLVGLFWAAIGLAAGMDYGWCVVMFVAGVMSGLFGMALCRAADAGEENNNE